MVTSSFPLSILRGTRGVGPLEEHLCAGRREVGLPCFPLWCACDPRGDPGRMWGISIQGHWDCMKALQLTMTLYKLLSLVDLSGFPCRPEQRGLPLPLLE